jgi:hypothetical protein
MRSLCAVSVQGPGHIPIRPRRATGRPHRLHNASCLVVRQYGTSTLVRKAPVGSAPRLVPEERIVVSETARVNS